jgi:hypothetical protein
MSGDREGALAEYQEAARRTQSPQEQRYLRMKASALAHDTREPRDGPVT